MFAKINIMRSPAILLKTNVSNPLKNKRVKYCYNLNEYKKIKLLYIHNTRNEIQLNVHFLQSSVMS